MIIETCKSSTMDLFFIIEVICIYCRSARKCKQEENSELHITASPRDNHC